MNFFKYIFLFTFFLCLTLSANENYSPFINEQIKYIYAINDSNITQDEIEDILQKQKASYSRELEKIMGKKQEYIDSMGLYDNEIFALEKIIKLNKKAENSFAVLRDEVQVKIYKLLKNQNVMIKSVLDSLNYTDSDNFNKTLNKIVSKNHLDNKPLLDADYTSYLSMESDAQTLKQAKQNIKEFNALVDINNDIVKYMYLFENKMYSLNKYSKYHLINTVIYINNTKIAKIVDSIFEPLGLNSVKILIMIFLIIVIYLIRKFVYTAIERNVLKIKFSLEYLKEILEVLRKPINLLIIIVNINMVSYVYNDFISVESLSKFFNITYVIVLTYIVYKILNVIASVKIDELGKTNTQIKNEVINVSIKMINFLVIVIGLLTVLHFVGVNLTAILSGLGIGGLAVALAAKDSLANFFGTLSILFSNVFSQGDWIEVDGKEGVVIEIGLRVTTIRTFDNALVAIPNASLANKDVKNWNKRILGRRIKMNLGIKYSSKASDIKNAVDEIRIMLDKHSEIATRNTEFSYKKRRSTKLVSKDDEHGIKKLLFVHLDSFSDSSINILIYSFSKSTKWAEWLKVKEDVMYKIMEILEKNNLEFAFPSLSIYDENENIK